MTLARAAFLLLFALLLVPGLALAQDNDGDGRPAGTLDCDDTDPTIYLNAPEICDDGIDQSCSGGDLLSDPDSDGWIDIRCSDPLDCTGEDAADPDCAPENFDCNSSDADLNQDDVDGDGFTSCAGDCDDADAGIDLVDDDGDGFDDCSGDCDDTDVAIAPGAEEVCGDGLDNDCDGEPDNVDVDGDGAISLDCGGEDCDDNDASLDPNTPEDSGTCNDLVDNDCDGVADNLDDDCFEAPEVDAGVDQQDRYLGGTSVIVLDGSGTTDFNEADVLTYTWTVEADGTFPEVEWALETDPTSPYAFFQFKAGDSEATDWSFTATLTVSDGVPETDDATATTNLRMWRPDHVPTLSCAVQPDGRAPWFALALLPLLVLRRRRA